MASPPDGNSHIALQLERNGERVRLQLPDSIFQDIRALAAQPDRQLILYGIAFQTVSSHAIFRKGKTMKKIFAGIGALALIGGLAACGSAATTPSTVVTAAAPPASSAISTAPATASPAPTKTVTASPPQVVINNNPVPAPTQTVVVPAAPGGPFLDETVLADSLAAEQSEELTDAPDEDYYSAGDITITTNCYPAGYGVYNCSASDTDGDTGYGDTVSVIENGNGWSDTGMNWTGPDIYIYGGVTNYWTTPAVSDWSS